MIICLDCNSNNTYFDGVNQVCYDCWKTWNPADNTIKYVVQDMHGQDLNDGDDIIVMKDLKVKGSRTGIKQGTKVKNIKLIDDGIHNIDCRIEGMGKVSIKSEFVKKA